MSSPLQAIQYVQANPDEVSQGPCSGCGVMGVLSSLLQAIQYVQANPDEVCPAGWKPGSKTMKPDPKV